MKKQIVVTVNGEQHTDEVEPRLLLVHYLRDDLRLTGTHIGCETSLCGACTVMLNGQAVKSCTVLAVQADGGEVLTVEGLEKDGKLHPLQEGFWEEHGLQCGFCTPGMIMASYQFLQRHPNPTEEQNPPRTRRQPVPLHGVSTYCEGGTTRREEGVGD